MNKLMIEYLRGVQDGLNLVMRYIESEEMMDISPDDTEDNTLLNNFNRERTEILEDFDKFVSSLPEEDEDLSDEYIGVENVPQNENSSIDN